MNVVDLHPEDLLDKLAADELTPAERERLDAHLELCRVCRFEVGVRGEFAEEMPALQARPQLTLPSAVELPAAVNAPLPAVSLRPRERRRLPLVLLSAALLLCAGGATAAVLSGAVPAPWLPWHPEIKPALAPSATALARVAAKPKRVAPKPVASTTLEPEAAPSVSAETSAAAAPLLARAPTSAALAPPSPLAVRVPEAAPSSAPSSASAVTPSPVSELASTEVQTETAPPLVDPAAALFAEANRARRDGNADRALTLYRSLQSRFPDSAETAVSRALLAQLLLDRGSPEAALASFDRYLSAGAPVLSAEALVGRARALEQLGKTTQAAAAWREVESRFEGSVHARLAATRLAALGTR